nr:DGQHR domain-containing protein [Roseomonas mucosa]
MQIRGCVMPDRADPTLSVPCTLGQSAGRPVLMGFAPSKVLYTLSFADVLDEHSGRGYQRRFNAQHSLDFRRYIQRPGSATIPLTFNLRPRTDDTWRIVEGAGRSATLELATDAGKLLAQVDCQHRLGHLGDLDIELPFMSFIGLSEREEMEVFSIINGKARGLSTSLLDFHDAQLSTDLGRDRPELYIALYLKNEPSSPWYQQLDLGGSSTSGMARRASLRTLQKAVKRFLGATRLARTGPIDEAARIVLDFWSAVTIAMPEPWAHPRRHLITKGIGVYALMDLAADLYAEVPPGIPVDKRYFAAALQDFAGDFDWTSDGPLKGLGGESGVKAAVTQLRAARRKSRLKVVGRG